MELEDPADSAFDSELIYDPGLIGEPEVILYFAPPVLLLIGKIFPK